MFTTSQLLSFATQPLYWVAMWIAIWMVALQSRPSKQRSIRAPAMLWCGLLLLGLLGFRTFPDALLRPLEARYPQPAPALVGGHRGLIVLGGMIERSEPYLAHGQVPLNGAAERLTATLPLLREHPEFQVVYTGGEGRLLTTGVTESEMAQAFFAQQGVPKSQILLEDRSRNTRENARFVARLLGDRCDQPWLLVTSAWHMPRAMAEFQAVGCNVTAYPVDYRTGASTPLTDYAMADSLLRWQTALHEWVGLGVYALTRSTPVAPRSAASP